MFDTIRLTFPIYLPQSLLVWPPWKRNPDQCIDSTTGEISEPRVMYVRSILGLGSLIRCTYFPSSYQYEPLLLIHISSFPSLVYGDHLVTICNLDDAVTRANLILNTIPKIPVIQIEEGVIDRIDFVFDHRVGDRLDGYIEGISHLIHPHRSRSIHLNAKKGFVRSKRNNGVFFSTGTGDEALRFYDLYKRCGDPSAMGQLRQESQLSGRDIHRIAGIKKIQLRDITAELAVQCLQHDLEAIGLNKTILVNEEGVLSHLLEVYPPSKAMKLAGFASFIGEHLIQNTRELAAYLHCTPQAINKYRRQLTAAGIAPTTISSTQALYPLEIDMDRYKLFLNT